MNLVNQPGELLGKAAKKYRELNCGARNAP